MKDIVLFAEKDANARGGAIQRPLAERYRATVSEIDPQVIFQVKAV
jgi:hypothetical protein